MEEGEAPSAEKLEKARKTIQAIYARHMPEKTDEIPGLVGKYGEIKLAKMLKKQYASSRSATNAQVGDTVEVYLRKTGSWIPGVVIKSSGAMVTASYTVKEDIPRGAPTLRIPKKAAAKKAAEVLTDNDKTGAFGPQEVLDNLPRLENGFRYYQVQKAGGMGRSGGGIYMFAQAGRTGVVLYTLETGEHFKTYAYEDLKSWEAGPNEIILEKRQAKTGLSKAATSVAFSTKPGEAMMMVEAIMKQVGRVVEDVKEAAQALGLTKEQRSKASLNRNYTVKKSAGKGRGKAMTLQCGQMGIQVFQKGEHYKTYNYKDLDEWATVSSTGSADETTHNRLILCKRNRGGMSTEYITNVGEATTIAHDITRKASELAKAIKARKASERAKAAGLPEPNPPASASTSAPAPSLLNIGAPALKSEELSEDDDDDDDDDDDAPPLSELNADEGDDSASTVATARMIVEYKARIAELEAANVRLRAAVEEAVKAPVAEKQVPFQIREQVEVFSRGLGVWLPGEVLEIDDDECKVSYTDGVKRGTKFVDMGDASTLRKASAATSDELLAAASTRVEAQKAEQVQAAAAAVSAEKDAEQAIADRAKAAGKTSPQVGAHAKVFSRSINKWCRGVVVAVGGNECKVKYKTGTGQIGEKFVLWGDAEEFEETGTSYCGLRDAEHHRRVSLRWLDWVVFGIQVVQQEALQK
eukprot:COSAG05_NODE_636_length_8175_cov_51.220530_7_plen_696_part_00